MCVHLLEWMYVCMCGVSVCVHLLVWMCVCVCVSVYVMYVLAFLGNRRQFTSIRWLFGLSRVCATNLSEQSSSKCSLQCCITRNFYG